MLNRDTRATGKNTLEISSRLFCRNKNTNNAVLKYTMVFWMRGEKERTLFITHHFICKQKVDCKMKVEVQLVIS